MSYGEYTRNPHEHTEQDEHDHPIYCRFCNGYLGQYETLTPDQAEWWNGWAYCPEHAAEMRRLQRLPDAIDEARR